MKVYVLSDGQGLDHRNDNQTVMNVHFHSSLYRHDSSSGRASASCVVGQDGCRIDTWPGHTKDVIKMVPVATLLGAQHYKASTGFSSLTNHASLTSHTQKKKKKSLIIINVCIDWRTEWKTGIYAKFVILLKYRNYYYYYLYCIHGSYEPRHDKNCVCNMRTTKTQIRLHSLVSVFVVRCLDSIMHILAIAKISRL